MKINNIFKIAAGLTLSLFYGCYDVYINWQLSLKNNSNKSISILYTNLNDERYALNNVAFYTADWNLIKPDSTKDITIPGKKNAWQNYINHGKTKKLYLYIFEVDTLKKYDCIYSMEEMVNQHKFLKSLSYSEKDLDKIKWQINFNR